MEEYGTIQTLIDVMNACGVENVFFNPGIDNVPVLETLARYRASGRQAPRSILCLDEFVTMTAAHGNYVASGRPQVVSVHAELGTQQIGGALHNAQWGRVPVVFFTEIQSPLQRTDWRGDAFDQGSMVRNFVKWDHQMDAGEDINEILYKAFEIATTEPCGPVYLTLPREVLWKVGAAPARSVIERAKRTEPAIDTSALEKAAELLVNAENPLIVTGYLGRNHETVAELIKLAEKLACPVSSAEIQANFPNTHPLAALSSPTAGRQSPRLAGADAILAIDYDMDYAAPPFGPAAEAKIIHIDIDTAKRGVPLWNKKPDILVNGGSSRILPVLNGIIDGRLTSERKGVLRERYSRLEAEHKKLDEEWQALAQSHAARTPISAHWLSYCIDQAIDEDTVVVDQCISTRNIVAHLVHRSQPGTHYFCPGGCIGWAPGAALGVKLAMPDKTVVSLMGDGAFVYGCPEASLWSANFYKAPYLAMIYNNQGYGAIKGLFREKLDVENMGADIPIPPDYAAIARACHAHGRSVDKPADVPNALKECLEAVNSGTPAVLEVRIDPV